MSEQEPTLDQSTRVSVRLLIAVGAPVVGATLWIQSTLGQIQYRLTEIERTQELTAIEMRNAANDRFRRRDMAVWVEMLDLKNPDLEIPNLPDEL